MDDYNDLVRQQTSYKEKRENKYKCESRDRLAIVKDIKEKSGNYYDRGALQRRGKF